MLEPMMPRQSRSLMLTMLADPDMDPLRDHPRFKQHGRRGDEAHG